MSWAEQAKNKDGQSGGGWSSMARLDEKGESGLGAYFDEERRKREEQERQRQEEEQKRQQALVELQQQTQGEANVKDLMQSFAPANQENLKKAVEQQKTIDRQRKIEGVKEGLGKAIDWTQQKGKDVVQWGKEGIQNVEKIARESNVDEVAKGYVDAFSSGGIFTKEGREKGFGAMGEGVEGIKNTYNTLSDLGGENSIGKIQYSDKEQKFNELVEERRKQKLEELKMSNPEKYEIIKNDKNLFRQGDIVEQSRKEIAQEMGEPGKEILSSTKQKLVESGVGLGELFAGEQTMGNVAKKAVEPILKSFGKKLSKEVAQKIEEKVGKEIGTEAFQKMNPTQQKIKMDEIKQEVNNLVAEEQPSALFPDVKPQKGKISFVKEKISELGTKTKQKFKDSSITKKAEKAGGFVDKEGVSLDVYEGRTGVMGAYRGATVDNTSNIGKNADMTKTGDNLIEEAKKYETSADFIDAIKPEGVPILERGKYIDIFKEAKGQNKTIKQRERIKEVNPLVEAKKYESAEDFFLRSKEGREALSKKGVKGEVAIKDWFKKNVTPKEKVLDNLNPTGGVLVEYNPKERMEMPLGKNITTLDKTMGKSPNETITIYRGAPKTQKGINPGDFITTKKELAESYAGNGHVISKEVKLSDVLDDKDNPLSDETIYRPNKETAKFRQGEAQAPQYTPKQTQRLKDLNKQFFGDDNIAVIDKIVTSEGQVAKGVYKDDMIKILNGQVDAEDTFYHEAVHKYFDLLTDSNERKELLIEARKRFKTDTWAEAEEELAENFIKFVKGERLDLDPEFQNVLEKIIYRIKQLFDNEKTIDQFYLELAQGRGTKSTEAKYRMTKKDEKLVSNIEKRVSDEYKKNIDEVGNAMGEVWGEMDNAHAGQSIMNEDGADAIFIAVPSTFPRWVPEELRDRKLFDKVMGRLADPEKIEYPKGVRSKERRLFNVVLDKVEERAGIDTKEIRDGLVSVYSKEATTPQKNKLAQVIAKQKEIRRIKENKNTVKRIDEERGMDRKVASPLQKTIKNFEEEIGRPLNDQEIETLEMAMENGATIEQVEEMLQASNAEKQALNQKADEKIAKLEEESEELLNDHRTELSQALSENDPIRRESKGISQQQQKQSAPQQNPGESASKNILDHTTDKIEQKELGKQFQQLAKNNPTSNKINYKKEKESLLTSFQESVQDNWVRVKKLLDDPNVKVDKDKLNPYQAEILYHGRVGSRLEDMKDEMKKIDKEIVKTAKKINVKDKDLLSDVNKYLVAKHAPERNAKLGDGASGMTTKEAKDLVNEIENKNYGGEVKRISKKLKEMNDQTLEIMKEGQLISDDLYKSLKKTYKEHVPLHRIMEESEDMGQFLTGKGLDVPNSGLKKAKGSDKEVADLMTNITANLEQAIIRAEKNRVNLATLEFAKNNKDLGLFEEVKTPNFGDENIIKAMDNGESVYLKVKDDRIAKALRSVGNEKVPALLKFSRVFTNFYSSLATRFNPEFVFSNKIRDLQEMAVYMTAQDKIGFSGAGKTVFRDTTSMKAVLDGIRGKDTKGAKLYQQMREDGGTTGGFGLSTRKQVELDLEKMRKFNRTKNPLKAGKYFIDTIDKFNQIFEDSTRLSVYKTALDRGLSRESAAIMAKEATLNFNKKGTGTSILNSLYMFSNASIQGSAKMLKSINPVKKVDGKIKINKGGVKTLTALTATVGGATWAVNEWNDSLDPDWREKVTEWDRDSNLVFVLPVGDGDFKYITIPVSYGLKPIKIGADTMYDLSNGKGKGIKEGSKKVLGALIDSYNPAGGTDLVSSITPTFADLPVDISRNKAWHGGSIRPEYKENLPGSEQYRDKLAESKSGQLAIGISEKIANATGKEIQISPENLVYGYKSLTGGMGKAVQRTATFATQGTDTPAEDTPFLNRFYKERSQEQIESNIKYKEKDEFFEEVKKYDTGSDEQKQFIQEHLKTIPDEQDRQFLLKDLREGGYKDLKGVTASGNIMEARDLWERSKDMSEEEQGKIYEELKKTDKDTVATAYKNLVKDSKYNVTDQEKEIRDLGVKDGGRAKAIYEEIKGKNRDEQIRMLERYEQIGVISDSSKKDIIKQMKELGL